MEVRVYKDYDELSRATSDLIGGYIAKKPDAMVCIASGHTPVGTFQCLVQDVKAGMLDLSKTTFVSLDEWIGVDPTDPGSCLAMLKKDFFDHLSLRKEQVQFFDVTVKNLQGECDRINNLIAKNGGLDIMLVGIGTNGHIGMNEPGSSFDDYAHIGQLAEATITTGQKYFRKATQLDKGITLGLRHFREAKVPIIQANGAKKAAIMKTVMSSAATTNIPATIVHNITHGYILLDREAGPTFANS
jgi:glucosamine-6-phosphate isomerase